MQMRMAIAGVWLVGLLAAGGILAGSASAEAPEFGRCVKVATGTGLYATGNCTSAGGERKFEWHAGPGLENHFTTASKTGTVVILEAVGGTHISCAGEHGGGEVSGPKSVAGVQITLTGCEDSAGGSCGNGARGEITWNALAGSLGISKSGETALKDKVALDLGPVSFEFSCQEFIRLVVQGSVLVPVHTNAMVLTGAQRFAENKGKQKPEGFEGSPKDVLEQSEFGAPFEQAALSASLLQTNEEKIEVSSAV